MQSQPCPVMFSNFIIVHEFQFIFEIEYCLYICKLVPTTGVVCLTLQLLLSNIISKELCNLYHNDKKKKFNLLY